MPATALARRLLAEQLRPGSRTWWRLNAGAGLASESVNVGTALRAIDEAYAAGRAATTDRETPRC